MEIAQIETSSPSVLGQKLEICSFEMMVSHEITILLKVTGWDSLNNLRMSTLKSSLAAISTTQSNPQNHTPENEHDNRKTTHLKMYPLLKMLMFHCHVSFLGGYSLGFIVTSHNLTHLAMGLPPSLNGPPKPHLVHPILDKSINI